MQAIITRYIPATNTRGARISAKCARGHLTIACQGDLDEVQNHALAFATLVTRFDAEDAKQYGTGTAATWAPRDWRTGTLSTGEHVFCCDEIGE